MKKAATKKASVKLAVKTTAVKRASKPVSKPASKAAFKRAAKPAPGPAPKTAPKTMLKPEAKPVSKPAPVRLVQSATSPVRRAADGGLTEQQLRKAPAKDYMNAGQLAFFRNMLRAMQREIHEKADQTSEHLREHEIEPDPTDQATIEEEYALELRARDRERKLLKKIDEALRRIEDGTYGWCEETGEAIGIPRMLARPTATLSVEAQTRRELKQKLYGD